MSDREIMDAKFSTLKNNKTPETRMEDMGFRKQIKPKQLPDAKKHQIISFIKSGIRILGYGLLIVNVPIAVGVLIFSEVIGIIEELV